MPQQDTTLRHRAPRSLALRYWRTLIAKPALAPQVRPTPRISCERPVPAEGRAREVPLLRVPWGRSEGDRQLHPLVRQHRQMRAVINRLLGNAPSCRHQPLFRCSSATAMRSSNCACFSMNAMFRSMYSACLLKPPLRMNQTQKPRSTSNGAQLMSMLAHADDSLSMFNLAKNRRAWKVRYVRL